ncbi:transcription factor COE1 [Paramuricea clavata]|uniref:Transcription factor COE1 n=1 Tax=Paramuricea clavata TaxID=317549 RepID=A0A7D9I9D0_PARCT|nr:transcription factor COE1 [Paramuricea clavata]
MYATALKILKEQFGQPSTIVRSLVNQLTKGDKIQRNDRRTLRELSIDLVNCVATMHQVKYFADVNASDNLRKIVMRLPDYLIQKWKSVVIDIREKQRSPTIEDISTFLRKQVKAEFDPDFGDMSLKPPKYDPRKGEARERHRINAAQRNEHSKALKCYVCNEDHKVIECPTLADSTVPERFNLAREARLCFSCLNKGHMMRDCRLKKKCEKNGCTRLHHQLLHEEPGTMSGISSVLDKGSILPVVRVCFRAPNSRTREGNVLIDSSAGTTVIRKDFARSLGLQGKREKIDLAVVGGERVEQPQSRRVTFSISALNRAKEHRIEAHKIEKTVLSVPRVQFSHLHAEDEVHQGSQFEPVGKRTKLGWFVISSDSSQKTSKIAMSPDDRRAIELMENSCKQQGGRYIIGLPWKKDKNLLPNNYSLAEKRLFSLERSLKRNDVKASLYNQVMNEYERNGWSRQLSQEEEEAKDKPSPDMASYVMIKIANENESQCPQAAVILKRDRYMDDLIHSTSTQEEAEKSKSEVDDMLATGSFKIKEWFVSSSVQEMQAENISSPEEENHDFKDNVIGVNSECTTTKNANLDGEEVTIKARVALQEIWKAKKYEWDDPLGRPTEEMRTLCATAYGAVAYLLWATTEGPKVNLIASRVRVAPLRQATIPRLELMAALVASRLASTIYNEFKTKPAVVKLWSDSKIVLHWLQSDSALLKAFVGV